MATVSVSSLCADLVNNWRKVLEIKKILCLSISCTQYILTLNVSIPFVLWSNCDPDINYGIEQCVPVTHGCFSSLHIGIEHLRVLILIGLIKWIYYVCGDRMRETTAEVTVQKDLFIYSNI